MQCDLPTTQATTEEVKGLLRTAKTIAVVGLSEKPDRPSYGVAAYMQGQGYRIIPVNPAASEILGEKSYASLKDIPEPIDIVDVFRKAEAVPEIADEAVAVKAKMLWLQEGVVHNDSAAKARAAGLAVVQNKCILKVHRGM